MFKLCYTSIYVIEAVGVAAYCMAMLKTNLGAYEKYYYHEC